MLLLSSGQLAAIFSSFSLPAAYTGVHSVVAETLTAAGWRLHAADSDGAEDWTLQWKASRCSVKQADAVQRWQRINHYPGCDARDTCRRRESDTRRRAKTELKTRQVLGEKDAQRLGVDTSIEWDGVTQTATGVVLRGGDANSNGEQRRDGSQGFRLRLVNT